MSPKDADRMANSVDPDKINVKFDLFSHTLLLVHSNDADGIANSVDPDQTAFLV